MVLETSRLPKNPLKKVSKLIMSILFVVILVTCIVIGLLIKHTTHKDEIYEHFTIRTEFRNDSIEETVSDLTTEVVNIMSLDESSNDTSLITSPALTTQMTKGRLIT